MATTMQKHSGPPGTVEKLMHEGVQALRSGRVAEAQDLARNLLARHPRNPDALELFGMTLLAQNKASEAIEPLQDAARERPGAIVEIRLGQALRRTGRIAEALTVLQQASERQPPVSDAFFELGTLLYEKRRVAEAEAVLIRGMAVAPAGQLSFALGTIFLERGDFEDASDSFARALAASPGHPSVLCGLGRARMARGDLERALEKFREAMANNPSEGRARFLTAQCLFELGRPAEAMECLRALVAWAPQSFGGALKTCVEAGKGRFWLKPSAAAKALGLKRP
ncbi:MAG: tetratricopeptide repeat protein [Xanthobacteraceae bacterium]